MKKVLTLSLIAGTLAFSACGPSKEEKEAAEKARQDSIAAVAAAEKATQDSLAMVQQQQKAMEDSVNNAKMQAMQDSIAMMSKKMNKPAPKPKTNEQKIEEDRKKQQKEKG